ncbi:uncharacterized mitochondrial protein AtMg00810-like [Lycium barbarum]|uniref:uncharacterized mitochondrial protein AtMg00810-like n=1 Tax=Lycium barbarum TaxID=112863 RepID=UPI00293F0AF2|nr:uncharacterized mitochondrial protein AtMg00810-like [Lycium barbarum]
MGCGPGSSRRTLRVSQSSGRIHTVGSSQLYLATTRPDISYAIQHLSQFMHAPKMSHYETALHVVRYIKGNPRLGLLMTNKQSNKITAHCDADWASCLLSRKSVTGFCIKLGDYLVSWK